VLLAHGGDDQIVLYVDSAPGRSAVGTKLTSAAWPLTSAVAGREDIERLSRQVRQDRSNRSALPVGQRLYACARIS
jgi:hypothetical protein